MYDEQARDAPVRNGLWHRLARAWDAFHTAQVPTPLPAPSLVSFAPQPPPPVAPNFQFRVPSVHPQFYFEANLAVEYRLDGTGSNLPADALQIAKAGILRRVERIASDIPITQTLRLGSELAIQLHQPMLIPGTPVFAWARCEAITVDQHCLEAVQRRERDTQDVLVQRWIWESQEYRIRYLDSLIGDPKRAFAWWMLRNEDKIDSMVGVAEQFKALRNTLTEELYQPEPVTVPQSSEPTMASLVDTLWTELSEHDREVAGHYLIKMFEGCRKPDLADTARQLLDVGADESPLED